MLKRPNLRACALETTASFLALPVPCVPGPREARPRAGPGDEDGSNHVNNGEGQRLAQKE